VFYVLFLFKNELSWSRTSIKKLDDKIDNLVVRIERLATIVERRKQEG
jgi:hypothetical protein